METSSTETSSAAVQRTWDPYFDVSSRQRLLSTSRTFAKEAFELERSLELLSEKGGGTAKASARSLLASYNIKETSHGERAGERRSGILTETTSTFDSLRQERRIEIFIPPWRNPIDSMQICIPPLNSILLLEETSRRASLDINQTTRADMFKVLRAKHSKTELSGLVQKTAQAARNCSKEILEELLDNTHFELRQQGKSAKYKKLLRMSPSLDAYGREYADDIRCPSNDRGHPCASQYASVHSSIFSEQFRLRRRTNSRQLVRREKVAKVTVRISQSSATLEAEESRWHSVYSSPQQGVHRVIPTLIWSILQYL
ncbi:hypothetical protein BC936DRAFT_148370 [Jimgerdemannia flammicorona]|uniref:Uncharacterized protein n=1 Tax=Jimgerdemannia flammicorona TaxID=994334 RepID=A0A433D356_9FUNG|nr:hypothetical protein BC936DRAFT_148370 [Jimgerdemannia flammicorona]